MKKYKAISPEQTIANIRNILQKLHILLEEGHVLNDGLYSCRVKIGNNGMLKLNIGTNGKGRSFEYSLASGYAEFMERLQNRMLLNVNKDQISNKTIGTTSFVNNDSKWSYSVDEKEITQSSDIPQEAVEAIIKMCGSENYNNEPLFTSDELKKNLHLVPFYDVHSKKEILLPIELILVLTGSNGMAAGNTPKEAILQAICEIFERYVINEIYWKRISTPKIPLEEYKGTRIYDQIVDYKEKTKYKVIIKDCSLGIGLPAIGMLIIDSEKQVYNFKIGVDFVPEIALERCFTEIHQGTTKFHNLPFEFIPDSDVINKTLAAENNLEKIFENGSGYWPERVVSEDEDYAFEGFNKSLGQSNKADMDYAVNLIKKLGYDIYIRDNSGLGFPVFFVVVPGMSQILTKKLTERSPFLASFDNMKLINNLGRVDQEIAEKLLASIDENYTFIMDRGVDMKKILVTNVNPDLLDMSYELLASLLALYLKDLKTFDKYYSIFLEDKDKEIYRYFYAYYDYAKMKLNDMSDSDYKLRMFYGDELANEVIEDFCFGKDVFKFYKLPNCPYCDKCTLREDCRMKQVQELQNTIFDIESSNPTDQMKVKEYIENDDE